jgi:cytochrome b subunit of formate dehydrogenase
VAYVQRLNAYHRILHIFIVVSFLGLVTSGMPLKYDNAPWAAWLMKLLGGYQSAGLIHRFCAVITFGYFAAHIAYAVYHIAVVKKFRFDMFGPESMVPNIKDIKDIYYRIKWFLGQGPAPQLDRWTYWEKFDYWAVFWGVGMIGVSGLMLWFPEFFGRFLPGWLFNVAIIIHSDEALLAAGFIFTIHFFNTHLRPEKFPMDPVIFTGSIDMEEFKHERPLEYQRLKEAGTLDSSMTSAPSNRIFCLGAAFGFIAVSVGLILLVLIVLGQFFY